MKNYSVARRYAKALYELAGTDKSLTDILQGLSNMAHAMETVREFERLLVNPLISPEEKQGVVKTITSNKLLLRFIYLLAKRDRMLLLPLIYEELKNMSDEAQGLHRALVKSVIPLTDSQKREVENALANRFGGKIVGQFLVEPELLGGVWVKVRDKVLDLTVRGRIDDLRVTLAHRHN